MAKKGDDKGEVKGKGKKKGQSHRVLEAEIERLSNGLPDAKPIVDEFSDDVPTVVGKNQVEEYAVPDEAIIETSDATDVSEAEPLPPPPAVMSAEPSDESETAAAGGAGDTIDSFPPPPAVKPADQKSAGDRSQEATESTHGMKPGVVIVHEADDPGDSGYVQSNSLLAELQSEFNAPEAIAPDGVVHGEIGESENTPIPSPTTEDSGVHVRPDLDAEFASFQAERGMQSMAVMVSPADLVDSEAMAAVSRADISTEATGVHEVQTPEDLPFRETAAHQSQAVSEAVPEEVPNPKRPSWDYQETMQVSEDRSLGRLPTERDHRFEAETARYESEPEVQNKPVDPTASDWQKQAEVATDPSMVVAGIERGPGVPESGAPEQESVVLGSADVTVIEPEISVKRGTQMGMPVVERPPGFPNPAPLLPGVNEPRLPLPTKKVEPIAENSEPDRGDPRLGPVAITSHGIVPVAPATTASPPVSDHPTPEIPAMTRPELPPQLERNDVSGNELVPPPPADASAVSTGSLLPANNKQQLNWKKAFISLALTFLFIACVLLSIVVVRGVERPLNGQVGKVLHSIKNWQYDREIYWCVQELSKTSRPPDELDEVCRKAYAGR